MGINLNLRFSGDIRLKILKHLMHNLFKMTLNNMSLYGCLTI